MNGIIQEILTLLKCEADRYSIDMRSELAAELPKIVADRVQLQQVFMNLMLNAIEAMQDSGGELAVRSRLEDSQLVLSVSDTGVGLPTDKGDEIFCAFFTTKTQGSGMGQPSAVPLWNRMPAGCGRLPTTDGVPPFISHCRTK